MNPADEGGPKTERQTRLLTILHEKGQERVRKLPGDRRRHREKRGRGRKEERRKRRTIGSHLNKTDVLRDHPRKKENRQDLSRRCFSSALREEKTKRAKDLGYHYSTDESVFFPLRQGRRRRRNARSRPPTRRNCERWKCFSSSLFPRGE